MGQDTTSRPAHEGTSNLDPVERQLPRLVEAFEYARDALAAAFPGWSPAALWLKRAEACRDLSVENAIAAACLIQHSTLCGALGRLIDEHQRIGDSEVMGIPTIRYIQQAVGPEDKIHPKRDNDPRLEIACRDHDAVTRLTGVERASASSMALAQSSSTSSLRRRRGSRGLSSTRDRQSTAKLRSAWYSFGSNR